MSLLSRLIYLFVNQIRDIEFDTNAISSDNVLSSIKLESFKRGFVKSVKGIWITSKDFFPCWNCKSVSEVAGLQILQTSRFTLVTEILLQVSSHKCFCWSCFILSLVFTSEKCFWLIWTGFSGIGSPNVWSTSNESTKLSKERESSHCLQTIWATWGCILASTCLAISREDKFSSCSRKAVDVEGKIPAGLYIHLFLHLSGDILFPR